MPLKHQYNTSFIVNEAKGLIYTLLTITLLIFIFSSSILLKFISLLVVVFLLYIFRNPERHSGELDENAIISSADGLVESIEEDFDNKFFKQGAYRIVLSRTIFDTTMLRASFNSKTKARLLMNGLHLSMNSPNCEILNQGGSLYMCQGTKKCIAVSHKCGLFRMALFYKQPKSLQVGERYGYIIGGKIEIYLPLTTRIAVKKGDRVLAGETLLAYFTA